MDIASLNNYLDTKLTLSRLEILLVELPQKEVFRSSIGIRTSRKAIIIKWIDQQGHEGYGECSCRPDPFYSHEFVNGAIEVIRDYLFPQIKGITSYGELLKSLEIVRGWDFTKSAIEFAANDMLRRKSGVGLIEAAQAEQIDNIPVGISLGLFDNAEKLQEKVDSLEGEEYQRLKFKISQDYHNKEILRSFSQLSHPNISFDANGAFNERGFDLLQKFAELDKIIEQPFPPGHFYLYQEYLKSNKSFKVCLDEEVSTYGHLINYGLIMDELNIKPGRVGGLWKTLKLINYCQEHGIPVWVGGMFETSIGRALNLQVASLLPKAKAHDLSPSNRYFKRDLVENPIMMTKGFINKDKFDSIIIDQKAITEMTMSKLDLVV